MSAPVSYCNYSGDIPGVPVGTLVRLPWQQVHLYPVDGDTDAPVVNEGRYVEGWVAIQMGGNFYVESSYVQQDVFAWAPYPFDPEPLASQWITPVVANLPLQFRVALYAPYLRLACLVSVPTHIRIQAWVVDNP